MDDNNGKSNLDDLIDWMFNRSRNGTLNGNVNKELIILIIWDAQEEKSRLFII